MSNEKKDDIQLEKANKKLGIIYDLINNLIDYNNINDYYNQKDFTINIDYKLINNYYEYKFIVIRGSINPKVILEYNIKYKNKLDTFIIELLIHLTSNNNFDYTSFNESNSYIINMKNNIKIIFPNHNSNDLKIYKNIESTFNKKEIISNYNYYSLNEKEKDKVQNKKLLKTFNIIDDIFEKIIMLNNTPEYENRKKYKLQIQSYKDKNYYKYNFKIIRSDNKLNLVEFTSSIKDNTIIYDELKKLINKYINHNDYIYTGIRNEYNNEFYTISLKNLLEIEFFSEIENDNTFIRNALNIKTPKNKKLIKN